MEEEKVWTHAQWAAVCPLCGVRRILWPNNQNVNSLDDPACKFIHVVGGKESCD